MKKLSRTVQLPPPPLGGNVAEETVSPELSVGKFTLPKRGASFQANATGSDPNIIVGLYLRVSTDRQATEGDSLEEQENELRKYCDYRNFRIHKLYIERVKSGSNTNRPEYQALIKDIEAKKINAVVVKKIDRLSRSLLDFEALMVILDSHGVDFISLREQFDTTTAIGKAMLRITLIFAQLEREQTAERIKDVFTFRAEHGMYNGGTRPFGYDSLSSELVAHKHEKKAVQFIFENFIKTKSTTTVARNANAEGYRTRSGALWDKRQIHKILIHPVYAGKIRWNGIVSDGIHQPLVTMETFETAQQIFKDRSYHRKSAKIVGVLKDVLFCGDCGGPMTPNYTQKKNKVRYYYYRCVKSLNPDPTTIPCKNYPKMEAVNDAFFELVLGCVSQHKFAEIEKEVDSKNQLLKQKSLEFQAQITALESELHLVQQKKETYLDSLVTHSFSAQERILINDKITEFGTLEKRLKSDIFKAEFNRSETGSAHISIQDFKASLIHFKANHETMAPAERAKWITSTITQVIYTKTGLKLHFKAIDLWI